MGVTETDAPQHESDKPATSAAARRQDDDARRRLRAFVAGHGRGVCAVVNYVGRVGSRIVLIAPDGEFGDVLASSDVAARRICEQEQVEVREWDRETTGLLAPTHADRVKMGNRTH